MWQLWMEASWGSNAYGRERESYGERNIERDVMGEGERGMERERERERESYTRGTLQRTKIWKCWL